MSVITCRSDGTNQLRFDVYAKGAPEMIRTLSLPQTVPNDFDAVLSSYTQKGYRVIALAARELYRNCESGNSTDAFDRVQLLSIEDVEQNLHFIGLLVMENRLKPETAGVIQVMKRANIRTLMVTGDNMMTALSVARECQLVGRNERVIAASIADPEDEDEDVSKPPVTWTELEDPTAISSAHNTTNGIFDPEGTERLWPNPDENDDPNSYRFAIDGKSWALMIRHHSDLIPKLVVRGTIFARFSPDQKKQVVEELQGLGYFVGMCGDGANDCGALKSAHAGISLSEAEASVASPFTSKEPNIGCVVNLVREGRAALVTSYGVFKFMAGYSLTQFLGACLLYWVNADFTDFQFLYQDLILATTLVITFCLTGAYPVLVPTFPKISLLSLSPFLSLFCIILCNIGAMIFMFLYTQQQPWYDPPGSADPSNVNDSISSTAVFLVSMMHYITMSVIFSKGSPYRLTMFRNYFFLANVTITFICSAEMIMYPANFWETLLQLEMPPSLAFRAMILGLSTMHFFIVYFIETYFIDGFIDRVVEPKLKMLMFGETRRYKIIDTEMRNSSRWPPLSGESTAKPNVLIKNEIESGTNNCYNAVGEGTAIKTGLMHEAINPVFVDELSGEDSEAKLLDDDRVNGADEDVNILPTNGFDNVAFEGEPSELPGDEAYAWSHL